MSDSRGKIAVSSKLGWLLSGPVEDPRAHTDVHSNLTISRPTDILNTANDDGRLVKTIEKFWETEAIGIQESLEEDTAESFITNASYNESRYEVNLHWKNDRPKDHYNLSYNRLKLLQRKLSEYDQIINDQLNDGIIERVTEPEIEQSVSEEVHHMPHH